ncbi:MAG: STAS domain-containing protein [Capsulimonadaceae bacterium]|nr:STAS domain-containing protein [Capsulimonadaceae bacterium]
MDMSVEQKGDVAVVSVRADHLDASVSEEFKRELAPVLEEHQFVLLDMGQLRFVDSAGLGAILSCLRKVSGNGGDLKLCNLAKPVRASFEIARMHRIMDILGTEEDALRAFSR